MKIALTLLIIAALLAYAIITLVALVRAGIRVGKSVSSASTAFSTTLSNIEPKVIEERPDTQRERVTWARNEHRRIVAERKVGRQRRLARAQVRWENPPVLVPRHEAWNAWKERSSKDSVS